MLLDGLKGEPAINIIGNTSTRSRLPLSRFGEGKRPRSGYAEGSTEANGCSEK